MKNMRYKSILALLLLFSTAALSQDAVSSTGFVINPQGYGINPQVAGLTKALDPEASKAKRPESSQAFDGRLLYKEAFEAIRDMHISLNSPDKLKAFEREWERKLDKDGALKTEQGTDEAIQEMLGSLKQRFDYYLNRESTLQFHENREGSLVGIGTTLRLSRSAQIFKTLSTNATLEQKRALLKQALTIGSDNRPQVDETLPGSPAEKTGLKAGDIITAVNGKTVYGMQLSDVVKQIKGPAGSTVTLSLERESQPFTVSLVRAQVNVPAVSYKVLPDGVGYVKLRNFTSKYAEDEMESALKESASQRGLILDLRDNPGGVLESALSIAGMILEDGPLLIRRERLGDRIREQEMALNPAFVSQMEIPSDSSSPLQVVVSPRPPPIIPASMPVIVLVDEASASASEILAGALQYNRRATVVGMPTVGKGVGQTVVDLPFGRTLEVTSFEFIPGRTPNDWIGVIPDVQVEQGDDAAVDNQLNKAQSVMADMIKEVNELEEFREERSRKNHADYQEALKAVSNSGE